MVEEEEDEEEEEEENEVGGVAVMSGGDLVLRERLRWLDSFSFSLSFSSLTFVSLPFVSLVLESFLPCAELFFVFLFPCCSAICFSSCFTNGSFSVFFWLWDKCEADRCEKSSSVNSRLDDDDEDGNEEDEDKESER